MEILQMVTVLVEDRGDLIDEIVVHVFADTEETFDPKGRNILVLTVVGTGGDFLHIIEWIGADDGAELRIRVF
ncbi:unknown [Clostridium sp. CAG:81]|nr:unknown [Clostridium sp. CAG:81]